MGVSHETETLLLRYIALLQKWQRSINLVSGTTLDDAWRRHIEDSLQLVDLIPPTARLCVDLGSGGGLPGIVIAIARRDIPGARVQLIESNGKKAAFLRVVSGDLALPVDVVAARIEDVMPRMLAADVITARALAPLRQLCAWTEPAVQNGALALFPKGRGLAEEMADAAKVFDMTATVVPSRVSSDSGTVVITQLAKRRAT